MKLGKLSIECERQKQDEHREYINMVLSEKLLQKLNAAMCDSVPKVYKINICKDHTQCY